MKKKTDSIWSIDHLDVSLWTLKTPKDDEKKNPNIVVNSFNVLDTNSEWNDKRKLIIILSNTQFDKTTYFMKLHIAPVPTSSTNLILACACVRAFVFYVSYLWLVYKHF